MSKPLFFDYLTYLPKTESIQKKYNELISNISIQQSGFSFYIYVCLMRYIEEGDIKSNIEQELKSIFPSKYTKKIIFFRKRLYDGAKMILDRVVSSVKAGKNQKRVAMYLGKILMNNNIRGLQIRFKGKIRSIRKRVEIHSFGNIRGYRRISQQNHIAIGQIILPMGIIGVRVIMVLQDWVTDVKYDSILLNIQNRLDTIHDFN